MKKTIKHIMMYIMVLMCCFVFESNAKAATGYGVYISGEPVTSDNMSGNGWTFEPAADYKFGEAQTTPHKLYLNNAYIGCAKDGISGNDECIYAFSNLEIVLSGENVICLDNYENTDSVMAVFGKNITFSGEGNLTITAKDIEFLEEESRYIKLLYVYEELVLKDNVSVAIEGCNISTDVDEEVEVEFYLKNIQSTSLKIGKGSSLFVKGFSTDIESKKSCVWQHCIMSNYIVLDEKANINIVGSDVKGKDVSYDCLHAEELIAKDNSTISITTGKIEGEEVTSELVYVEGLYIEDNVSIEAKYGEIIDKGYDIAILALGLYDVRMGENCKILGEAITDSANRMSIGVIISHLEELKANSVLRGYGSHYGILYDVIPEQSNIVAGGQSQDEFTNLSLVEITDPELLLSFQADNLYTYQNSASKSAKYVNIGPKVTINFSVSDGTVSKSKITRYNGEKLGTLPTPVSSRAGYTFAGWYTAASGGTKVYSTTKMTKSTTLYAQWKKNKYTISFNANGGKVNTAKKTVEHGKTLGTLETPTRTGYTFTGWYTAKTGGTKVYSTTKATKNMTLYAQWKIKTYTINFNGNGGTVGVAKKWVDHGNAMNFMPTPKRSG
ncbi:MAG: InlB B-repeat-containing protein, partial [Lachnospiraceae bacterium]|nr:InlB B-repeat-containing protein [Lachnospiraceae bacterium]